MNETSIQLPLQDCVGNACSIVLLYVGTDAAAQFETPSNQFCVPQMNPKVGDPLAESLQTQEVLEKDFLNNLVQEIVESEEKGTNFPISLTKAAEIIKMRKDNLLCHLDPLHSRRRDRNTGHQPGIAFVRPGTKFENGDVANDYLMTTPCFKELIMKLGNKRGHQSRRYFSITRFYQRQTRRSNQAAPTS